MPFFHKGTVPEFRANTNNARCETTATSGAFKFALRDRPASPPTAICEWTGSTPKTKHAITMADGSPLFLAGLRGSHEWQGERTESYTMVMQDTAPGDDMHVFHDRQPVLLDRAGVATWVDTGAGYMSLLRGFPAEHLGGSAATRGRLGLIDIQDSRCA